MLQPSSPTSCPSRRQHEERTMNTCTTMKADPSTIGSDVYYSRYSSLTDYINHNQISGLRDHIDEIKHNL